MFRSLPMSWFVSGRTRWRSRSMGAADILVVKVQPLGGVVRTLDIAARPVGIPVVVSSALETSIGIYSGFLVASLLPELPYACGLGTVYLSKGIRPASPSSR